LGIIGKLETGALVQTGTYYCQVIATYQKMWHTIDTIYI